MPRRPALPLLLALVLALAGCSGAAPHPARSDHAVIRFHTPVTDAELWFDGIYYADGLRKGVEVKPGNHRIEIRHDRYHTWYAEVRVAAGEQRTVAVDLAEILP
jgi:hypothetical protein